MVHHGCACCHSDQRKKKELVASSLCREARVEEQDDKEGVAAEISGDGELGWRSGGQGQELREATKTKTWCNGGSMSVRCITRVERERERSGPSSAASFTSGGGNKGGDARWNWSWGVGRLRAKAKGRRQG
jgi:hypothetical protein